MPELFVSLNQALRRNLVQPFISMGVVRGKLRNGGQREGGTKSAAVCR